MSPNENAFKRVFLSGDREVARTLLNQYGDRFLSQLKEFMSFQDIQQLKRNYMFPDGSTMTVQSIFGIDAIYINGVSTSEVLTFEPTIKPSAIILLYSLWSGEKVWYKIGIENGKFTFNVSDEPEVSHWYHASYFSGGYDMIIHPSIRDISTPNYEFYYLGPWPNYPTYLGRYNLRQPDGGVCYGDSPIAYYGIIGGISRYGRVQKQYPLFRYGQGAVATPEYKGTTITKMIGEAKVYNRTATYGTYDVYLLIEPVELGGMINYRYPWYIDDGYLVECSGRKPYAPSGDVTWQTEIGTKSAYTENLYTTSTKTVYTYNPNGSPFPTVYPTYDNKYTYNTKKKFYYRGPDGKWVTDGPMLSDESYSARTYSDIERSYSPGPGYIEGWSKTVAKGSLGSGSGHFYTELSGTIVTPLAVLSPGKALFHKAEYESNGALYFGLTTSEDTVTGFYSFSGLGRVPTDWWYSPPVPEAPAINALHKGYSKSEDRNNVSKNFYLCVGNANDFQIIDSEYLETTENGIEMNIYEDVIVGTVDCWNMPNQCDAYGRNFESYRGSSGVQRIGYPSFAYGYTNTASSDTQPYILKGFDVMGDVWFAVYEKRMSTITYDTKTNWVEIIRGWEPPSDENGHIGTVTNVTINHPDMNKTETIVHGEYFLITNLNGGITKERIGPSYTAITKHTQGESGEVVEDTTNWSGEYMANFSCHANEGVFVYSYIKASYDNNNWKNYFKGADKVLWDIPSARVLGAINVSKQGVGIGERDEIEIAEAAMDTWPSKQSPDFTDPINAYSWKDFMSIGLVPKGENK